MTRPEKFNFFLVGEAISGQNSQKEILQLPECDQQTTGNPFVLSAEVKKSNEMLETQLKEIYVN